MLTRLLSIGLAALCLSTLASASSIFNFDSDALGASTTFTDTSNGLSATFSSPGDPGGFVIYPTIFSTLTGNVLGDPGPAGLDGLALDVAFSQNLSNLSLDFATDDFGSPSTITLYAYNGSSLVGSASATGTVPNGFTFPEGTLDFSGSAFNSIVLSSTAPDIAVDNLDATTVAPVPEPSSFALLGTGILLIGMASLRGFTSRRALRTAATAIVPLAFASLAGAQVTQSIFPLLPPTVSTVPSNGDVNPYGVAFVPKTQSTGVTGILQAGDILVSNFNDSLNLQGTGHTIVRIDKTGNPTTFFTSTTSQGGLTAALGVLSNGWVLVGSTPTSDGTAATIKPGQLLIVGPAGNFLGTLGTAQTIDGPWGIAIHDTGNGSSGTAKVFISNVLSGTISRFNISYTLTNLTASVQILAEGFNHRLDPVALVLGPSGMAYNAANDTLYVASSDDNAVYQIPTATTANSPVTPTRLFQDSVHLHGPLALSFLPDGNLLAADSDGSNVDPNQPSELVEYTPAGVFLNQMPIDPNNGGAFGLAVNNIGWGTFRLAAVDDNTNSLHIWTSVVP
jgi:hypothetical protein